MHTSNRFVVVCNIQFVIRMLYHSFETLLLLIFFYIISSSNFIVKIRSRFHIAFFLSKIPNLYPHAYLCLANVPTSSLILSFVFKKKKNINEKLLPFYFLGTIWENLQVPSIF